MQFAGFLGKLLAKALASGPESVFARMLHAHFQTDADKLPIISESLDFSEQPHLHLALETYLAEPGRSAELHGVSGVQNYNDAGLTRLASSSGANLFEGHGPAPGPVQYNNVSLDEEVLACVHRGLYLIRDHDQRYALYLRGPNEIGFPPKLQLEVMGGTKEAGEHLLGDLRRIMRTRNVYRGRVLSFGRDERGMIRIEFHRLPKITRDQIIFPAGLLERIERQTVLFSRHSARLLAAGRHLRRGVLLHGKPGTGKTLTAMYLASQMADRTVLLLTGIEYGTLPYTCNMARRLQPSIVILEDVDLIAADRSRPGCPSPLLFELLNQMDGVAEDTDAVFLLTTNRPEILEPALAARPGRIDQAVEIPLPDAESRRRLFELYGRGLTLQINELDRFIENTKGASAAFIRELLRKAALFAADESVDGLVVTDRHLDEAMRELVVHGGELTKSLLGAEIQ